MARLLKVHQQLDRDEVADGQRVSRRVKADIRGANARGQVARQAGIIGGLVQQASPP